MPPRMIGAGEPSPLGATLDAGGVNIAVFSANATAMDVCLFDPVTRAETARLNLPERTGDIHHGRLEGIRAGQLYGFRVHGPYAPQDGHRFNPNKLLLDPYGQALSGPIVWDDSLYGFDLASPDGDLSFDARDSAPFAQRSVVVDPAFDWGDDARPDHPWSRTFVYEAHVKGLTRLHPDIPPELRGTYGALGHPAIIDHLTGLGVTALELLPVHAFANDRFLLRRGLTNYWGYSTLGFFAPEPRYGTADALKGAIRALHRAGIEVILDVVYNHTAEAEETGPTLSFRGLDNATYYKPRPGDPRRALNCTGCGNALDLSRPPVARMVLDSLLHFARDYRVDGFRFDLATTLGRNPDAFDPACAFFRALAEEPGLRGLKLIAEPWDVGQDGYQLGRFPPGVSEWNDRFRDTIRSFWRGDPGRVPHLAQALSGSREIFQQGGRGPEASINYAVSHDGFTAADLVSYRERRNWDNGEENRDGHGGEMAVDHGIEGPTDDPVILAARARHVRNLLATVFLSQGVPMLSMGDELSRSQGGNNNPYCQDNATSWLDWERGRAADPDRPAFVAALAAIRQRFPSLRREKFFSGDRDPITGRPDVVWLAPDGHAMAASDWQDGERRCLGLVFGTGDDRLLLLLNAGDAPVSFHLPADEGWSRILDTAVPDATRDEGGQGPDKAGTFALAHRSLVLFRADQRQGLGHASTA